MVPVLFANALFFMLLGCGEDDVSNNAKKVNEPCTVDGDCVTEKCYEGICASKTPLANGGGCYGNGDCKSYSCKGGGCVPGTKSLGKYCRYNEECASGLCMGNKCDKINYPEAGPDAPTPDIGIDSKVPDIPKPDMKKDLGPPDQLIPDAPKCTQKSECDDSLSCTDDDCVKNVCVFILQKDNCLINGACVKEGTASSSNDCMKCVSKTSTTAYSPANTGTCDDKLACTWDDTCSNGTCKGTPYACDDKLSCTSDSCTGLGPGPAGCKSTLLANNCLIGLICYPQLGVEPSNVCHKCDVSKWKYAWTAVSGKACVTTYAGTGSSGSQDGKAYLATFSSPRSIVMDSLGNLIIADTGNSRIRMIDTKGIVSTIAGSSSGFKDGTSTGKDPALLSSPYALAMDSSDKIIIADSGNNRIRVLFGGLLVTLAGNGLTGKYDGSAISVARFSSPKGVAVEGTASSAKVYVADTGNRLIRLVTGGIVSTVTGLGSTTHKDGALKDAGFTSPVDIQSAGLGNYYVTDASRIRLITSTAVSTIAGSTAGFLNGVASKAQFSSPGSVYVAAIGKVLIPDTGNNRIRLLQGGMVTTYAGSGTKGLKDDIDTYAWLSSPYSMVGDGTGRYFIADSANHVIRLYTP